MEDLAEIAAEAARSALEGWSPGDTDSVERLTTAIGMAVAAGIRRHEESNARHTALAMAGLDDEDDGLIHWQV
jgi:hypothetical protein